MTESIRRALVLSGGGVKGAYQTGVLAYLLGEEKQRYQIYAGTSVGALNAAYLAMFPPGQEEQAVHGLTGIWRELRRRDVIRRWFPFGRLHGLWKPSVYDSRPLRATIERLLDLERIRKSRVELRIGAVSLKDGRYRTWTQADETIIDAVAASSAFPSLLAPVTIDGEPWADGGVREPTPVSSAIAAGATQIDIVVTSPPMNGGTALSDPSALDIAGRAIDAMLDEIIDSDIRQAEVENRLKRCGAAPGDPVEFRVIRPQQQLAIGILDFDGPTIRELIDQGYADVCRVCNQPPQAGF